MNRKYGNTDSRYRNIIVLIVILMLILAVRLFVLTVIQHDRWTDDADNQSVKVIYTPAPRGNIYDRNGKVLATNTQMFTVNFNGSSLSRDEINKSSLDLIRLFEKNGDEYKDDFPIKKSSSGRFYYTFDRDRKKWLTRNGFSEDDTASEVLESKKREYCIKPGADRYESIEILNDDYRVSLPIVPKTMKFTYDNDKENFLRKFGCFSEDEIEKGISAKKCFEKLRDFYEIDESLNDEDAEKIFTVRNPLANNRFKKYMPVTIATDISDETLIYLEETGIPGAEISSASKRYYPEKNIGCHVIGYMGAITEKEMKDFGEEKGYLATDIIGRDGVEAAFENNLHGTPGMKKIKVNSAGDYVKTISETPPKKGSDIHLSIDFDLQKAAQEEMKSAVGASKTGNSAAAVAIDPNNGDVLALASYPDFDPNIFSDGISEKEWKSVQPENPRDCLSPAPLYNNATRTSVAPGSTFKIATAYAALECGLNPNRTIVDKGFVQLGDRKFGCFSYNFYGVTDGVEDLAKAIEVSCNYYFYCIASNKDWGTGSSMGESGMGIDKILDAAGRLGLGQKTGIEIGETVTPLPSEEGKLENYKIGAWNAIYLKSTEYFPKKVYNDEKLLRKNIDTITSYIDENPSYGKLCEIVKKETDVREDQVESLCSMVKFDYFEQAKWTMADAFNICIGQGGNSDTPLQMANYAATVGNGGYKYKISLVSSIEGKGKVKKPAPKYTGMTERQHAAILKGMKQVASGNRGTMSGEFRNYPVQVAGKSGTAENQGVKQPVDEVEYIKNHLGEINGACGTSVTWEQVENRMKKLMIEEPNKYLTENDTVDAALIKESGRKITSIDINKNKESYNPFAWTISFAPADKPEIAIATLMIEGNHDGQSVPKVMMDQFFGEGKYKKEDSDSKDKKKD